MSDNFWLLFSDGRESETCDSLTSCLCGCGDEDEGEAREPGGGKWILLALEKIAGSWKAEECKTEVVWGGEAAWLTEASTERLTSAMLWPRSSEESQIFQYET